MHLQRPISLAVAPPAAPLRRAVLVLARRLRPALQGDGLTPAKLSVVGQLYRSGPLGPSQLAAREGVKMASLTRLVAALEGEGWVGRTAHPTDGRRSVLDLTARGRERLIASAQVADAALAEAIARVVDVDELPVLLQACGLLERIGDALTDPAGSSTPADAAPEVAEPPEKTKMTEFEENR